MTNVKLKATTRRTNTKSEYVPVQSPTGKAREARDPDDSRSPSKLDVIKSLMARTDGATLEELVSVTGWQPHSVRAGMTGLRKQGLTIVRAKTDGTTRFAIETQPVEATA